MEDVYVNVDSRYRDTSVFPSESNFTFNLDNIYKNIASVSVASIELSNTISYIDNAKANNFFTIYFPNAVNDPTGVQIKIPDSLYPRIEPIQNIINSIFVSQINHNSSFELLSPEKYFYIFYLNNNVTININGQNSNIIPVLNNMTYSNLDFVPLGSLTLNAGWYSVYGYVNMILNYLKSLTIPYNIFQMQTFTLPVFDRRFVNIINPANNNIRMDVINSFTGVSQSLNTSLVALKNSIYNFYLHDIITFQAINHNNLTLLNQTYIPNYIIEAAYGINAYFDSSGNCICNNSNQNYILYDTSGNYIDTSGNSIQLGILDLLLNNRYVIPSTYVQAGQFLNSGSKYYISSNNTSNPRPIDTQLYNLYLDVNSTLLRVNIDNIMTNIITMPNALNFYYYYVTANMQTWSYVSNDGTNSNLLETSANDIPDFEINFNTYRLSSINPYSGNVFNIGNLNYPTLGYYLGYRQENYISQFINSNKIIAANKMFTTIGENYIFLRINDWGKVYLYGNKYMTKVMLAANLGNPLLGFQSEDYSFKQPQNIKRLDIEFVDYLGNTVNFNGVDISFTLKLTQIYTSEIKSDLETNYFNLRNIPPNYNNNSLTAQRYGTNYNNSFINKK